MCTFCPNFEKAKNTPTSKLSPKLLIAIKKKKLEEGNFQRSFKKARGGDRRRINTSVKDMHCLSCNSKKGEDIKVSKYL